MRKLDIYSELEEKIFELKTNSDGGIVKIVSYFPLTNHEKQEILRSLESDSFDSFSSIFSDSVSEEEWNRTKEEIKKKFHDELFEIDNSS